jgi:outer membrane immunogenic protein
MKVSVAASAIILGLAAPSIAADLPVKAVPPAPAAVLLWNGFYIGAHAGYGWGYKDWTQTFSSEGLALDRTASSLRLDGFLGGAQIGWNYRSGLWVFGLEADWSWTDASDCKALVILSEYSNCSRAKWYATGTARVGRVWNDFLIFAKGGLALVQEEHHAEFLGVIDTETTRRLRAGWTVGAGFEHVFAPRWSWKVEYNYLDFGTRGVPLVYLPTGTSPGLVEDWDVPQRVHAVKLGINYHFGALR